MKRIAKRMLFLLGLMGVLALGLVIFVGQYLFQADSWAAFPGSPHAYRNGNLSAGVVTDRTGVMLLDSTDGRVYTDDAMLKRSILHLMGDREGFIAAPMLSQYAEDMVGFSLVNGLYGSGSSPNYAKLTIYASVQKAALEALGGRKGTIGVYNYKTGEILCAVSAPNYDPDNVPDVAGDVTGAYEGVYVNRFLRTTYVPGSIYKIITTAAALEQLPDAGTRTFYCEGSCQIGADTINCNGTHYTQTLGQALANSCNVAFAQLAVELGPTVMTRYAGKVGIEENLSFDGITTAAGHFDLNGAADSQIAWSGIGQYTDLVNPCQFMTVMGAIANGGSAAAPYLMKEVDGGLFGGYEAETRMLPEILDADTCRTLSEYMRNNVVTMYGQWQFPDLYVCAKSGTAELSPTETPHATFSGFIQDDNYPFAFIVVVEHGGSGSATCAPIAGQVLNACCSALDAERMAQYQ